MRGCRGYGDFRGYRGVGVMGFFGVIEVRGCGGYRSVAEFRVKGVGFRV